VLNQLNLPLDWKREERFSIVEFNGEFNGINSAIIELTCTCVRLPKTCLLGYFSLICWLILVGDGAKRFTSLRHKHLGLTSDHDISWP